MKVISLGGSLIIPQDYNISFLKSFIKLLKNQEGRFVIVCGGGALARRCQQYALKAGVKSKSRLDWIGISATRQNAELVKAMLGKMCGSKVISDPREKIKSKNKFIVACGWKPGRSTDYDAVMIAKTNGVNEVINLSNVDYVYTKDPKIKGAKPIEIISWKEFTNMFKGGWKPGAHAPFDPVASRLAKKCRIKVIITGKDLKNFKNILSQKKYSGTTIN